MRIVSPPTIKTTIYDKNISGIVLSVESEYQVSQEYIIHDYFVPVGYRWIINSVALRLGYTTIDGTHNRAVLTICVGPYTAYNHILGLSLYTGDGIMEKNMSISPNLVLAEGTRLVADLYMAPNQDPVFVSYHIAISQLEK